jgi:hypothetical protein
MYESGKVSIKVLVGNTAGSGPIRRVRRKWEYNIKMVAK